MHYIQKYILDKLILASYLRNRDMRPPRVESNLYQYHLKRLIDSGYIERVTEGYTLSTRGLQYADKHSSDLKDQRPQPKLVTILLLENENGETLLIPRKKQPFIGMYNLPSGKIHEGETLLGAGRRELAEKVGVVDDISLIPAGTVHLTITRGEEILSESYGFVLRGAISGQECSGEGIFSAGINNPNSMPGVDEIIQQESSILEIKIDGNTGTP